MFDFAAIVSFGGLLYWTSGPLCKTYLNYTSEFIRKVLIESTISTSEKHYITSDNKQAFQWLIDEKRKLIFLVFWYQRPYHFRFRILVNPMIPVKVPMLMPCLQFQIWSLSILLESVVKAIQPFQIMYRNI